MSTKRRRPLGPLDDYCSELEEEIDQLKASLREIQKINSDGFKAPEVASQLIAEVVEAALA